jgi:hypothetical protein
LTGLAILVGAEIDGAVERLTATPEVSQTAE